jgi:hypothetical protein
MTPKLPLFCSILALCITASSLVVPATDAPKLILAPFLPTLESLGLTVADLYKPDFLGTHPLTPSIQP